MAWEDHGIIPRRVTTSPFPPLLNAKVFPRDINWHEFIPARAPKDGAYLIVYKHANGYGISRAKFTEATQNWDSLEGDDRHFVEPVTHYARIDLPLSCKK